MGGWNLESGIGVNGKASALCEPRPSRRLSPVAVFSHPCGSGGAFIAPSDIPLAPLFHSHPHPSSTLIALVSLRPHSETMATFTLLDQAEEGELEAFNPGAPTQLWQAD